MAPSSPLSACFTAPPSKPSFAILTRPGRRVASKMPSVVCAASSRARPTSRPSRIAASTPSCAPTTTPHGNALTSKNRQKCSNNCCTFNVNPPPRFRGDDSPKARPHFHLHRGLDVVVAHDLAPARDLALEQRARGGRRALLLRIGRDPGLRPGLEDRRIGHDLLQRGIELRD